VRRELVAGYQDLAAIVEPLLVARRVLREQLGILHRQLLAVVRRDEVCRRLMTMPGVGPVVALTFRATIDVPARFTSSKSVGAVFGLTPRRHQSGEIDRMGGISKCGDGMMCTMLFEAAQSLLTRTTKWSWLKLGRETSFSSPVLRKIGSNYCLNSQRTWSVSRSMLLRQPELLHRWRPSKPLPPFQSS
jgi:transposase